MRITHFELLQSALGKNYLYLEKYFENMAVLDVDINHTIEEAIFDRLFPPEVCSNLFGTPQADRSTRVQRKMDLAVIRQAYHLWKDKNYFDISPSLSEKLIDTDLRDVDTFFIQAPYRSMYLSLPKGTGINIPNVKTGLHEVEAIYIAFNDFGGPMDMKMSQDGSILTGVTKHLHMLVCGETKGVYGDAVMFFDLIFFEGKVSESIERNKEILENPSLWEHIVEIFNYVSKVLLYINCANTSIQKIAGLDIEEKLRGLKSTAKKRKLLKRYSKVSPKAHNLLDVVISRDNGPHGQQTDSAGILGAKGLEKVRRHFKVQHFGTGWSKSKIIWVESYLRGEGTEFYKDKHTYRVT